MKKWQIIAVVSIAFIMDLVTGLVLPLRLLPSTSVRLTVQRDEPHVGGTGMTSYPETVRFNDVLYEISYGDYGVLVFGIFGNSSFHESFPAESGSKFIVFGMEGVISEVHDSYIVILVKSL